MEERAIIIADRDSAYRSTMAGFFRKAGYRVEATGSTDQMLSSIQDKKAPVLLLGSDFGGKVASADLVHLLKKCHSQLQIIVVSDKMTLAQARQVRQEGIFFQALKPASAGDAAELGQVVACAFQKQAAQHQADPKPAAQHQSAVSEGVARAQLMHTLPWFAGIVAIILGTNYLSLPAANTAQEGSSLSVWLFLGFCAVVVCGQVLPIFHLKLALSPIGQRQHTRENTARGGK